MPKENRKNQIIKYANNYADIAISEGSKPAIKKFWDDYTKRGLFNAIEQLVILHLTKAYILCKKGEISREDCSEKQNVLLNILN